MRPGQVTLPILLDKADRAENGASPMCKEIGPHLLEECADLVPRHIELEEKLASRNRISELFVDHLVIVLDVHGIPRRVVRPHDTTGRLGETSRIEVERL